MIIKGSLRALRRPGAAGAEIQEAAAEIDEEVGRLNRIVDDVLDFARPLRLEYAQVDLNALCKEATGAARTDSSGLRVRLSLETGLAPIVTDGERLRTALVNVLSNAREAVLAKSSTESARGPAGAGSPAPDIELSTRQLPPGQVAIVVEDRGIGIKAADLPHVFEPYFTSKRTGTGLGLAITRNIVEALGGSIVARPLDTGGTQVRLELPTLPAAARPPAERPGGAS
jgi:signal transduction histidine kinase